MIVAHARSQMRGNPQDYSVCAALQSILAYAQGLEKSSISCAFEDGRIVLTGEVDSLDALETAIAVAEVFTGRTVVADLSVQPRIHLPRYLAVNDTVGSETISNRA